MGCLRRVPAGVPPVYSGGYCSVRGGRVEAYPSSIAGAATGMWPGSCFSGLSGWRLHSACLMYRPQCAASHIPRHMHRVPCAGLSFPLCGPPLSRQKCRR